jgi:oligopeptide/dipeptide ABC transporter ATP-binding protein
MRQRVMIAIALACEPKLIIADEPTTALDVTVQAQVLDLLLDLRDRLGLALILITHDLGVVAETADRVAVMYAGRKVEEAPVEAILLQPRHPYTQGLIRSTPEALSHLEAGRSRGRLQEIPGMVPKLHELPPGCAFASRCAFASDTCRQAPPPLVEMSAGHEVACYRATSDARVLEPV